MIRTPSRRWWQRQGRWGFQVLCRRRGQAGRHGNQALYLFLSHAVAAIGNEQVSVNSSLWAQVKQHQLLSFCESDSRQRGVRRQIGNERGSMRWRLGPRWGTAQVGRRLRRWAPNPRSDCAGWKLAHRDRSSGATHLLQKPIQVGQVARRPPSPARQGGGALAHKLQRLAIRDEALGSHHSRAATVGGGRGEGG